MRKFITLFLPLILLCMTLTGCKSVTNVQDQNIKVTITDSYYKAGWMQPVRVGKTQTYIRHSAKHVIVVEYQNESYSIDDTDLYNTYKDKIGTQIDATLRVTQYDNNTSDKDILINPE